MKGKKILSSVISLTIAFGAFAALPAADGLPGTAITASAETSADGFILETDSDGDTCVTGYEGKGGKITIPTEASYVDANAFKNNTDITSVTFPEGTATYGIGAQAFYGCTNLKTVVIKGDCAFVGAEAFRNCVSLKSVSFGGNLEYYEQGGIFPDAFRHCSSLRTVKFAKEDAMVDFIGENAFMDCFRLNSINLPSGLKSLESDVFTNCVSLKNVKIPADTAMNGDRTFGFMLGYGSKAELNAVLDGTDTGKAQFVMADGSKIVYREYYSVNEESGKLNTSARGIKQCEITLSVVKGSSAEKWAADNGIKYVSKAVAKNGKLSAPSEFRAAKSSSKIRLSWNSVEGADGYRIYKYNPETKKFEKYKSVKGTICMVSGLESGTKYRFRIASLEKEGDKYIMGNVSEIITVSTKEGKKTYPALELSDEARSKLCADFAEYQGGNAEDKYVHAHFGTYNGCEVVVMWDKNKPVTFDMQYVTVGGQTIAVGSGSYELCLHKDSEFIAIEKAYQAGYLTDEDIAAVLYYSTTEEAYSINQ